ncbi:MAG: adenylosuccinate lyase [Mycoplasmataceae bacterium]|nr:adenylosuccinate lyase [Mycoplasmataceae bacterium]
MINRYQRKELKEIWSDKSKYESWLLVELYSAEAYAKVNKNITENDIKMMWKNAKVDLELIEKIEKETRHDVIAFTRSLSENMGSEKKWVHYGLTSTDVVDTGLALNLKKANNIIKNDLIELQKVIQSLANKHKFTYQMGRTHGVHAEVSTFGYKLAIWWDEMNRNIERFQRAADNIEVGKISGAVGNYSNVPLSIQDYVCEKMDIKSSLTSTQTLQRDRHAEYVSTISIIGASLDKFATELRHLQRTEVREVEEGFAKGQKGSSAMPHKKNPISSENISGLSRVLKGYSITALENVALWHERDISHSSAERIILPDATSLIDYMLVRFTNILSNIGIKEDKMLKNISLTNGVIFSQRVMLFLINDKKLSREEAYDTVQPLAMKSFNEEIDFGKVLIENNILNELEVNKCFNLEYYSQNIDAIFKRLKI